MHGTNEKFKNMYKRINFVEVWRDDMDQFYTVWLKHNEGVYIVIKWDRPDADQEPFPAYPERPINYDKLRKLLILDSTQYKKYKEDKMLKDVSTEYVYAPNTIIRRSYIFMITILTQLLH